MFYDINKLYRGNGILRFPISMSRISNAQSPAMYFSDYIPHINSWKILEPTVNAHFCYATDLYYQYSPEYLGDNRAKFTAESVRHKNEIEKILAKPIVQSGDPNKSNAYYIKKLFNFYSRFNLYISYPLDFCTHLSALKRTYDSDALFRRYLQEDCIAGWKEVTDNQTMFFLEEHLLLYLISKMQIQLKHANNESTERILIAYPWVPLKHQIYIFQQNFLKLPVSKNYYESKRYDLTNKILRDVSKIDLETYDYTNV